MKIVTPKQMTAIEDRSEKAGVSRRQLMEKAGKSIADIVLEHTKEKDFSDRKVRITFLAGSGNNGGDCYVAAEILVYCGYEVTVVNLVNRPSTPLAQEMFGRLPERVRKITGYRSEEIEAAIEAAEIDYMTIQEEDISDISDKKEISQIDRIFVIEKERIESVKNSVSEADFVVDGVFGTGFHGQLPQDIADIFQTETSAYKIAVDIPSGGDSGRGTVSDGVFEADETVCLGYMKIGMTQYPLKEYCGKITVADIGIPSSAREIPADERQYFRVERNHLKDYPVKRAKDSYKGDFGNILVIAGSSSMRGAAAFAALGAYRSGAGLVRVVSVEKCIDTISLLVPETTYLETEADDYGYMLYDSSKNDILEAMKKASAIVIGCGMGVTNDTMEIMRLVLQNSEVPVVVDADGINCIAKDIEILTNRKSDVIITPHVGEMARLLECETNMVAHNRIMVAEKYAEKYGITVVLKGAGTIIANERFTAVNHTGNSGMSKGGSGDILAGIIATSVGQGYSPFYAACAGVYIHGLAGDCAAEKFGQEAMLARDIADNLSTAFGILRAKKEK